MVELRLVVDLLANVPGGGGERLWLDVQDADGEDAVAACVQHTCTKGQRTEQEVRCYQHIKTLKIILQNISTWRNVFLT